MSNSNFGINTNKSLTIKKNLIWLFLIKVLSVALSFFLVPYVLKLINVEKYGLWVVLFSIVSWLGVMDFGLGNGFRNKFIEADSNNNKEQARHLVQTLYSSIGLILIFVFIIFSMINPFINWNKILNISINFDEDINHIVYTVFFLFLLQFYTSNISTIFLALQKSALNSSLLLYSNVLSISILFILNKFKLISLYSIAVSSLVSPIIINILFSIYYFNTKFKEYRPSIFKLPQKRDFDKIFGLGIKYFIIQIAMIVMFSSDNFIITSLYGPSEVTPYNTSFRLFSSAFSIYMMIITPFWSFFTKAIVETDVLWIIKSIKNLIKFWIIFIFIIIFLAYNINFILNIWLSGKIFISRHLAFELALYIILLSWINIFTSYINATSKINLQLKIAIFQMIFNIPTAILLARYLNFGVPGILMATNINLLISAILLPIQTSKLLNNNANGFWKF